MAEKGVKELRKLEKLAQRKIVSKCKKCSLKDSCKKIALWDNGFGSVVTLRRIENCKDFH